MYAYFYCNQLICFIKITTFYTHLFVTGTHAESRDNEWAGADSATYVVVDMFGNFITVLCCGLSLRLSGERHTKSIKK